MDKNKHDDGKIRPSLIPTSALRYISQVREYGLNKYPETGENGWKDVGRQRFLDALCRHLINYIDDPYGVDEESGLPIIAHIACNAAFLCWFDEQERQSKQSDYILQMTLDDLYHKMPPMEWKNCADRMKDEDIRRKYPCTMMALDKFIEQGYHFKETKKGDNK